MWLPEDKAGNLTFFYALVNEAKQEASTLKKDKIDEYINVISKFMDDLIVGDPWKGKVSSLRGNIANRNLPLIADSLAEYYYIQNPHLLPERAFLEYIQEALNDLLTEVIESDLSKELKEIFLAGIQSLLKALYRYQIDGPEEIGNLSKALVVDLTNRENKIQENDREKPAYKKFFAWLIFLGQFFRPSIYDVIGAAPDLNDYWIPRIERIAQDYQKIEEFVDSSATIQEAFEKSQDVFSDEVQKKLLGQPELPALLPADESLDSADSSDESEE